MAGMAVLNVYREAVQHINRRGYLYVWANLLWLVLSLPLITAPVAWAGLVHLSHTAQTQATVQLDDFWAGFKANFGRGLVVGLISVGVVGLNLFNALMVPVGDALLAVVLRIIWLGTIVIWFGMQLYMWVILEEMAHPSLLGALRNAVIMFFRNPWFTLGLWLGIALIVLLSMIIVPLWLLLTGSTIAIVGTAATLNRLDSARRE
jgi:uncharacterized membrane protein YesL